MDRQYIHMTKYPFPPPLPKKKVKMRYLRPPPLPHETPLRRSRRSRSDRNPRQHMRLRPHHIPRRQVPPTGPFRPRYASQDRRQRSRRIDPVTRIAVVELRVPARDRREERRRGQ